MQVALPPAVTVVAGQSALAAPLMAHVMVPEGVTGVRAVAASCAVNLTEVSTLTAPAGTAAMPTVAASALTVCVMAGAVAVL